MEFTIVDAKNRGKARCENGWNWQPGGVLIFHGLLHHGTPPNFSEKRRRSIQIHYAPQSASKLSPREYKRMFTNEMTNAEC